MKITNISVHKIDIPLVLKDADGSDVTVNLKYDQVTFTPTNEKTRTVNMHGVKRNIGVSFDDKPDHLEYFKPYYKNEMEVPVKVEEKVKVLSEPVSESLQDLMNFEAKIKDIDTEDKSEVLFEKSKEAIGADEDQLYADLNLDAIKESVKEYVEESKPKPKRTTKSKRGPGRPKKRGPKPKKKPVGRPKGSKSKKK